MLLKKISFEILSNFFMSVISKESVEQILHMSANSESVWGHSESARK